MHWLSTAWKVRSHLSARRHRWLNRRHAYVVASAAVLPPARLVQGQQKSLPREANSSAAFAWSRRRCRVIDSAARLPVAHENWTHKVEKQNDHVEQSEQRERSWTAICRTRKKYTTKNMQLVRKKLSVVPDGGDGGNGEAAKMCARQPPRTLTLLKSQVSPDTRKSRSCLSSRGPQRMRYGLAHQLAPRPRERPRVVHTSRNATGEVWDTGEERKVTVLHRVVGTLYVPLSLSVSVSGPSRPLLTLAKVPSAVPC